MKGAFLLSIFLSCFQKSHSQIPNNSFEEWDIISGVELPVSWQVDYGDVVAPTVWKDTSAYSGTYSLRMLQGSMNSSTTTSSFKVLTHPYQLNGFFKGDQYNHDTLKIRVEIFNLGLMVDTGQWLFTSYVTIDDYTPFTIEISQNALFADSAKIEIKFIRDSPPTDVISFYIDYLYFDDNIGIEQSEFSSLEIFPSLTTDYIIIQNQPPDFEIDEMIVINSIGQRFSLAKTAIDQINVSPLPAGSYQLIARNREKMYWGKFLKL